MKDVMGSVEDNLTELVAKVAPWVSPLPTAYLTSLATVKHLAWPEPMGIVSGVIIECLGLAATATALTLREYNQTKRKSDPVAPFGLAAVLVAVYFGSVTSLTVLLDTMPDLATFAPLVFPVLSLAGISVLALRSDHKRRLAAIEGQKAHARARRQARRLFKKESEIVRVLSNSTVQADGQAAAQNVQDAVQDVQELSSLDAVNLSRQERKARLLDALLDIYRDDPTAGATDIARRLGIGRSTVYHSRSMGLC